MEVDRRLSTLETQVTTGNDRVVHILGEQLATLQEIKCGQSENFARMWQLTLNKFQPNDKIQHQSGKEVFLRQEKDQAAG
jgi:hypothetical protein